MLLFSFFYVLRIRMSTLRVSEHSDLSVRLEHRSGAVARCAGNMAETIKDLSVQERKRGPVRRRHWLVARCMAE